MKRTIFALLSALLFVIGTTPVSAQQIPTKTTLSAAVTSTAATSIVVTSNTDIVAGSELFIDHEMLLVASTPASTTVQVRRGAGNTSSSAHLANAQVWVARPEQVSAIFRTYTKVGSCTATNEAFLPQIDVSQGNVQNCNCITRTAGVCATATWGGYSTSPPDLPGLSVTLVSDANYVANDGDVVIVYGTMTANRTVVLPSVSVPGHAITVVNDSNSPFLITFGSGTIAGSTTTTVVNGTPLRLVWSGASWFRW